MAGYVRKLGRVWAAQEHEEARARGEEEGDVEAAGGGGEGRGGAGASSASAGKGASSSAAAGSAGAEEEEDEDDSLKCLVCTEIPNQRDGAALTRCGHGACASCLGAWIAQQNHIALPGGDGRAFDWTATALQAVSAQCMFCRVPVFVRDVYTFGLGSSARELAIAPLDVFMAERGGGGTAAARAAAAASSSAPQLQLALPGPIMHTDGANAVKLRIPGGPSAAGDAYGAKIATLLRRLRSMPAGDKAVVATSWPRLRPVVADALRAEGIDAVVLEGTPAQMASVVQQFTARGDPHRIKVMLLAVGTDCAGLTLTVANHLFILDPILSPMTMAQLIGRVARQGQAKPVYVYHMAVRGSIEERMVALRADLARGTGSSGSGGAGAALASSGASASAAAGGAKGAAAGAGAGDTNAASTERLSTAQLLRLLDLSSTGGAAAEAGAGVGQVGAAAAAAGPAEGAGAAAGRAAAAPAQPGPAPQPAHGDQPAVFYA